MIVLEILKLLGFITILGKILTPIMLPLGLPGEMGLVWATTLTLNLYNGLAVFFALSSEIEKLTLGQVTVLMSIMLVAHSLPVEQKILQNIGLKIIPSTLFRLLLAYLYGFLLSSLYRYFDFFNTINNANQIITLPQTTSLFSWVMNTFRFLVMMFIVIFLLITLLKVLEKLKIDKAIARLLSKLLFPIGVSPVIMPSMMIGVLLGISYGGGLLIEEIKKNQIPPLEVIKVMLFLSLSHSLIEDTLIVMTTGAHYSGVLIGRLVFTFLIMLFFNFLISRESSILKQKLIRLFYR